LRCSSKARPGSCLTHAWRRTGEQRNPPKVRPNKEVTIKRRLITCFIAGVVAGLLFGGFHEWTPPAHAASNFCDTSPPEEQFDSTYAVDNQPPPTTFLVGLNGQARLFCTSNWRVTYQPLFKLPADSSWTVGFDNPIYMPNATGHYAGYQDVLFTPGSAPPDFTGYWTNGDGLRAQHPVCQYQWRVRERFTNTGNGTLEGTLYSPTVNPSC